MGNKLKQNLNFKMNFLFWSTPNRDVKTNFSALSVADCGEATNCAGYSLTGSYTANVPAGYDLSDKEGFLKGETHADGTSTLSVGFSLEMDKIEKDYFT